MFSSELFKDIERILKNYKYMKCIVLYHEKVTGYLLKYDLAEIQKMGKKNEVNKARFRLLYFVVNAFL